MASTLQCPYCGSVVRSDERSCPGCGAANAFFVADAPAVVTRPQTIEQLQEYCAERNMPLLRMRFFIGEDHQEPRAFGIYREGRNVVVYKNKSDGSRAVRYRGPDEARAVGELLQKLQDECRSRGIDPDRPYRPAAAPPVRTAAGVSRPYSGGSRAGGARRSSFSGCLDAGLSGCLRHFVLIFVILILLGVIVSACTDGLSHGKDGYYRIPGDDRVYYFYGGDWYYSYGGVYDDAWIPTDDFPESDSEPYRLGDAWSSDWGVSDFRESDTWDGLHSGSSSSDYDSWDSDDTDWDSSDWDSSDWDSSDYDSWDSGGTDWDSDW